jgi:hypothetical protein
MNFDYPAPSLVSTAPAPVPATSPAQPPQSSKSKSKHLWIPFCDAAPGSFDCSYSIESVVFNGQDIGELSVLFRTINQSDASLSLDLSISSTSSGSYRLTPSNQISLTSSAPGSWLPPKSEETHQLVRLDLAPTLDPLLNNSIDCLLQLSSGDTSPLISTDTTATTRTLPAKILLSLPAFFQPHPATETEFQALVSNTSSARQSLKIPILEQKKSLSSKRSERILKQLVKYLRGHPVEAVEGTVTCCSSWRSSGSGGGRSLYLVCGLLKVNGRESCVAVEIKCSGSDPKVAQQIGTETARALSLLTLS